MNEFDVGEVVEVQITGVYVYNGITMYTIRRVRRFLSAATPDVPVS